MPWAEDLYFGTECAEEKFLTCVVHPGLTLASSVKRGEWT